MTYEAREMMEAYIAFIAAIDNSVAKEGFYGTLADYVDGSALANATSTDEETYWGEALATAKMVLDCWEDYYPELIK